MTTRDGTPVAASQLDELRRRRSLARCHRKNWVGQFAGPVGKHVTFADCTPEDVVALLCAGEPTVVPAHWAFLQERTPADAAYVLLEGNARVFRNGIPIADLNAGDVVGETALLNGTLRNATVTSTEQVKALRIERRRFEELLRHRPNLRDAFNQVATARLAAS